MGREKREDHGVKAMASLYQLERGSNPSSATSLRGVRPVTKPL